MSFILVANIFINTISAETAGCIYMTSDEQEIIEENEKYISENYKDLLKNAENSEQTNVLNVDENLDIITENSTKETLNVDSYIIQDEKLDSEDGADTDIYAMTKANVINIPDATGIVPQGSVTDD